MEKVDVQKLINVKSERISYETYEGKSAVWKNFVLVKVDGAKVLFVKCMKCSTVLKWKSKDGTSGLSAHQDSCSPKASVVKITDMSGFIGSAVMKKVPGTVKSDLADGLVKMCAKDIRPFSIVEGAGFKAFAQKLIAVGHKYGDVSIDEILPSSTTVSHHMESVVVNEKAALCEKLSSAVGFGITTDGWTHSSTDQQYITVTIHFIDLDWVMLSFILAIREADEKHTAEYI